MRKSECRGIPSQPALLTGHGTLPAQKPDRRESPPGDSADKTTGETCSGKSSNGKEKRPRSRCEKVSVPGFFHTSPEIKIPSPEKEIPGLGISLPSPEFSRQTVQKVNDSDKILHKSPVLCKKIARKSAIWAGLRKSHVTEISQNGTICLFLQAFHDILILGLSKIDGDLINSARGRNDPSVHHAATIMAVLFAMRGHEILQTIAMARTNFERLFMTPANAVLLPQTFPFLFCALLQNRTNTRGGKL